MASGEARTRAVFMGTPHFAVPPLEALLAHPRIETVGVFTQPDKPVGRGLELRPPPVKNVAEEAGVPVFQPKSLRKGPGPEQLAALSPELILVAAYGKILPEAVLQMPRLGCVNVHASLLPKYRGAAPINYAVLAGEEKTGITLMQMDVGLDTGPMLRKAAIQIGEDETAGSVHDRLAALGGRLVADSIDDILDGRLQAVPQDDAAATLAPKLSKEDGRIPWSEPAQRVHDHVRGMQPWPGAFTEWEGKRVLVLETRMDLGAPSGGEPGQLDRENDSLFASCGSGRIELLRLQLAGRKPMSAADCLRGQPALAEARLG